MNISKPVESTQPDKPVRTGAVDAAAINTAGSSRTDAVEKTAPVDAVRLSPTSRQLTNPADEAPVRMDKVEQVGSAIREGRFQVNAHAVADRLISQAAELLETLARK